MSKSRWALVIVAAVGAASAAGRNVDEAWAGDSAVQIVASAMGLFMGSFVILLLLLVALSALGNLGRKHWARRRGYCAAVTPRRSRTVAALVLGMIGVAMLLVAFLLLAILLAVVLRV